MDLRTNTGARILEVFWWDADRRTAGLLVTNGDNTWPGEWDYSELRHQQDLRALAQVVIEDGQVLRNPTA